MTRGLSELGVTVADLQMVQRLPFLQAQTMLSRLKDRAKHNFRRLCKELHPDINGGDVSKTERFKMLSLVKSELDKLQVDPAKPPPPRPPSRHVPTPVGPEPQQVGVRWVNRATVDVPIAIRPRRNGV